MDNEILEVCKVADKFSVAIRMGNEEAFDLLMDFRRLWEEEYPNMTESVWSSRSLLYATYEVIRSFWVEIEKYSGYQREKLEDAFVEFDNLFNDLLGHLTTIDDESG